MELNKEATIKRFLLLFFFLMSLFGLGLIFNVALENPDASERFYILFVLLVLTIIIMLMTYFTFMMLGHRRDNSTKQDLIHNE